MSAKIIPFGSPPTPDLRGVNMTIVLVLTAFFIHNLVKTDFIFDFKRAGAIFKT